MLDYNKLLNAMADLEEDTVLEIMRTVMEDGGSEAQKAMEACQEAMVEIGRRFEMGEYFVGDLIFSGEVMNEALALIKPALSKQSGKGFGKLILCTVQGDLHDIGKNIVKSMLEAGGFEVVDLGIDTPPEKILKEAKADGIKIIALSGVLTLAINAMKKTVEAFEEAGLRSDVKIIIGGNPVTEEVCKAVGADEWAINPQKTVDVCKGWAIV